MSSELPPAGKLPGKTWKVGTLVYTTPALLLVFVWLLGGDFLENMRERGMAPVIQLLLKRFEASNLLIGLLLGSLPTAVALLLNPIISMVSDRHRGRWGRRIPFIAIPLPFTVLAMIGLAFAPTLGTLLHTSLGDSSPGANTCVIGVFFVMWTIYELTSVLSGAVFGGLVNDVVPQAVIGRFYGLFRASSLLAGILFNYFLLGGAEEYYFWLLITMAALVGLGHGLICWKVKEGTYPQPEPLAPGARLAFFAGVATYIRECFAQPFYLLFFAARTFGALAFSPLNAFSIFYAKSIGLGMDVYGKYVALTYAISIIITYTIGSLADRFHPLRLGILFMATYALFAFSGWIFAVDTSSFLWFFVIHGVLSGAYFTGTASLGQRILPRDRFAQFASAGGMFTSVGVMFMTPFAGFIIDATGQNYRYTFLMNGVLSFVALVCFLLFYRAWKARGGDAGYTAP